MPATELKRVSHCVRLNRLFPFVCPFVGSVWASSAITARRRRKTNWCECSVGQ